VTSVFDVDERLQRGDLRGALEGIMALQGQGAEKFDVIERLMTIMCTAARERGLKGLVQELAARAKETELPERTFLPPQVVALILAGQGKVASGMVLAAADPPAVLSACLWAALKNDTAVGEGLKGVLEGLYDVLDALAMEEMEQPSLRGPALTAMLEIAEERGDWQAAVRLLGPAEAPSVEQYMLAVATCRQGQGKVEAKALLARMKMDGGVMPAEQVYQQLRHCSMNTGMWEATWRIFLRARAAGIADGRCCDQVPYSA
jgi:hypothetical protein